jgi:hypothetical protein
LNTPRFWADASDRWGTSIRPDFISGGILIDAPEEIEPELPTGYALEQNYPNPFNTSTQIAFQLPEPTLVAVEIYGPLGRKITTPASGTYPAGRQVLEWDAGDYPSGVYFYRLVTPNYSATRKMLLLR